MRARATLTFNTAGTYRIAAASDDGRYVRLNGVTVTSVGGSGGTTVQNSPNSWFFPNPSGHEHSYGEFTVAAGTVATLDSFFWERGGGDSFELSISNTAPYTYAGNYALLTDGALGGAVSVSDIVAAPTVFNPATPGFRVQALNVIAGGGSTTNDLNTATQTLALWNAVDASPGAGTKVAGADTFNVENHHVGPVVTEIDYRVGGAASDFPLNRAPSTIGAGLGGDDYSIRAQAILALPVGDYALSLGSDDGRYAILNFVDSGVGTFAFSARSDQVTTVGIFAGTNTLGFDANTGFNQSVGRFSITAANLLPGTDRARVRLDGFFWDRSGGDDHFEIGLAPDDSFTTGDANFMALQNQLYGANVFGGLANLETSDNAVGAVANNASSVPIVGSTFAAPVRVGTTGVATEAVIVRNIGYQDITGTFGAGTGDATGAGGAFGPIAPGATASALYTLSPTALGPVSGNVTVTTNAGFAGNDSAMATLSGTGVGPIFNVEGSNVAAPFGSPLIVVPGVFNVGTVDYQLGQTSVSNDLDITNGASFLLFNSLTSMEISGISLTDPTGRFSLDAVDIAALLAAIINEGDPSMALEVDFNGLPAVASNQTFSGAFIDILTDVNGPNGSSTTTYRINLQAFINTPEPGSVAMWSLLALAAGGFAVRMRGRRRA